MTSHYEVLGVPKNASAEEIKRAYRKKARKTHPDKEGGSEEKFHPIVKAYEVLSDDARRFRYDQDGDDESLAGENLEKRARQQLQGMLVEAVMQLDVDRDDLVAMVREAIDVAERDHHQQCAKTRQRVQKFEKALKRLRKKGRPDDFLGIALRTEAELAKRELAAMEEEKRLIAKMRELLDEYGYEVIAPEPSRYGSHSILGGITSA